MSAKNNIKKRASFETLYILYFNMGNISEKPFEAKRHTLKHYVLLYNTSQCIIRRLA